MFRTRRFSFSCSLLDTCDLKSLNKTDRCLSHAIELKVKKKGFKLLWALHVYIYIIHKANSESRIHAGL